jgi:hypothetical protein
MWTCGDFINSPTQSSLEKTYLSNLIMIVEDIIGIGVEEFLHLSNMRFFYFLKMLLKISN